MINLGVIGLNEGNGHPYSYSSILNGFDNKKLQTLCPFNLIKEYLPLGNKKYGIINDACVKYIWTQDKKKSYEIAQISQIDNILENYEDMIGKVDGVILARDDPWNHLEMAKPFLKNKIPIFLDKQLTSNLSDLNNFIQLARPFNRFMACSPIRFNRDLLNIDIKLINKSNPRVIHGVSRVNWLRYAHHIFEGIVTIFGHEINTIQVKKINNDYDFVIITYKSGLRVHLDFIKDISLPIFFTVYSEKNKPFTIEFNDFYLSFKKMLESFITYIKTDITPISHKEIISIAKIVIAGDISKNNNGLPINPKNI